MISAHSPPHELREPGSFSSSSVRINAEQVRFCGAVRGVTDTQTGRFTQLEQRRTRARTDAAARPSSLCPPSALLSRKLPAPVLKDTVPRSSAAVSSGHLPPLEAFIRLFFGRSPPSGVVSSRSLLPAQTRRGSHMELLQCCGGAKPGFRL